MVTRRRRRSEIGEEEIITIFQRHQAATACLRVLVLVGFLLALGATLSMFLLDLRLSCPTFPLAFKALFAGFLPMAVGLVPTICRCPVCGEVPDKEDGVALDPGSCSSCGAGLGR